MHAQYLRRPRLRRSLKVSWAWLMAIAALATVSGFLIAHRTILGLALAAACVLGTLAFVNPSALVVAVPATSFLAWRVGGGSSSISFADVAVAATAVAAIPLVDWEKGALRRQLSIIAAFQGILLLAVLATPTKVAELEWLHRISLVAGALLIGAAISHQDKVRSALRLFIGAASVMALLSVEKSAATGFTSAYPLGFNKNFVGDLLMMAILVLLLLPERTGISPQGLFVIRLTLVAGLLATQSRGSMVALMVGLVILAWRDHLSFWRTPLPFLLGLLLVGYAVVTLTAPTTVPYASTAIGSRATYQRTAYQLWRHSMTFGVGLRYFITKKLSVPGDLVIEVLTESGLVGAAALTLLLGGTVRHLRRLDSRLAFAALVVLAARVTHGLFDVYWIAGSQSFPWILIGMAVGSKADSYAEFNETGFHHLPSGHWGLEVDRLPTLTD